MSTVLVVPGLNGSGADHWQTWLETRLDGCLRVELPRWDEAKLWRWAVPLRHRIEHAKGQVWIIAHGFGCLACACVATRYRERIAGAMLVAPAEADQFGLSGALPDESLGFPSVVIASTNDPRARLMRTAWQADRWGSRFVNIGAAGHINPESGFGPWPEGLEIFESLRRAQADFPLGSLEGGPGGSLRPKRIATFAGPAPADRHQYRAARLRR